MPIFSGRGTIVNTGGGGGGSGHTPSVIYSDYARTATLSAAAEATDTVLTVADVFDVNVGLYFDEGIKVAAVDADAGTITLDAAIGQAVNSGVDVTFAALAGTTDKLVIPKLTHPTEMRFWGYVDGVFYRSHGVYANATNYWYVAERGGVDRVGTYWRDHPADAKTVGAAFQESRQFYPYFRITYDPTSPSIKFVPEGDGATGTPSLYSILLIA